MYLKEIDIPNFNDYLKLTDIQRQEIQSALAVYYGALRRRIRYEFPVIEMIKEDLYELELAEEYEACKLYLDTIEHIKQLFDGEIR